MKMKNRNRPGSDFSRRTMALAEAPTTFTVYSVSTPRKRKAVKATADLTGLSRIDLAARVGDAMVKQGKHVVKGCRVVFDRSGRMVIGFGSRPVWRDERGCFCKAPVVA